MTTVAGEAAAPATHHEPQNLSDRFALAIVKIMRAVADTFFAQRYNHRAVVLETVAAVPGMVGGTLRHLGSLRRMEDDDGIIRELLDEAENERMHLMTFVQIVKPTRLERLLVVLAQGIFYNAFFLLYLISPRTAHRVAGYLEEEAIVSYDQYLQDIDAGRHENVSAPPIALRYWNLKPGARLRDVVLAIQGDEEKHRNVNHRLANSFQ